MHPDFVWHVTLSQTQMEAAEAHIREDLLGGHIPFQACHAGPVQVALGSSDPLASTIVGNIKCSCGELIGAVEGTSSGSSLSYAAPAPQ